MCGSCGGLNSGKATNRLDDCCQPRQANEKNPCVNELKGPREGNIEGDKCVGEYERHLYEAQGEGVSEKGQIPGYAGHVPTGQSHKPRSFSEEQKYVNNKTHVCPTPLHEPYRIPGYTGHVQGLQNMVGGTYGHDTHKLMYATQPYPNRQENISPYRPKQSYSHGFDNGDMEFRNGGHENLDSSLPVFTGKYKKPDEHYYKPQYKYRIGDTYATRADLTLVDPCVNEESKVIISTRELDDTQVVRNSETLEERLKGFPYINRPIRHRPMVPGFDSYIDAMRGSRGQRYEFTDHTPSEKKLQQQIILEKGSLRKPLESSDKSKNEVFSYQNSHSNGDLPFGYGKYDGAKQKYTNSVIYDFTSNYRRRQSTEWAPATISCPDPPAFDVPGEIYNQHTGLLPGYTAHIPGALFRCGKTFTDDSRDAKKALRGDRF